MKIKPTAISLAAWLQFKADKKAATTGSHMCDCGARISRNKDFCLNCVNGLAPKDTVHA